LAKKLTRNNMPVEIEFALVIALAVPARKHSICLYLLRFASLKKDKIELK
jgi:hypothetical protein